MSRNRHIKILVRTLKEGSGSLFRCAHGVICQPALCCNSERDYCLPFHNSTRHFAAHHPSHSQPWMEGCVQSLPSQFAHSQHKPVKPVYLPYSSYSAGTYNARSSTAKEYPYSYSTLCSLALSARGPFFGSCPGPFSFTPTRLLLACCLSLLPSHSSLFPLSLNMQIHHFPDFLVSQAIPISFALAPRSYQPVSMPPLHSSQHAPTYPLTISLFHPSHAAALRVRSRPARV
ncbi:hypothetical protein QBC45DRAFT_176207 [Copromyces sp. CBS 386.78]|nr:hypothetical protein QBC45DRAFT_176207 [Copromyces sp. CBS 386.78]